MASLPKVRDIESMLKSAQQDPRLIKIICEMAERMRVQHQQIMQCAEYINKQTDLMIEMMKRLGQRDNMLEKLGIEEMIRGGAKSMVESVDASDDDTESTHEMSRKKPS